VSHLPWAQGRRAGITDPRRAGGDCWRTPILFGVEIAYAARAHLVRRGKALAYITLGVVGVEVVVALVAGVAAGSVALLGFGVDSLIELTAAAAALWRLRADRDPTRRERAEGVSLRIVGVCFLALATYVAYGATQNLLLRLHPAESPAGIALAGVSLVSMPLLARAKQRVALGMRSGALAAEAQQTALCAYLAAILLFGLLLNAVLGWWWADPVAALLMVPIIVKEGLEGVRGRAACGGDCC
jgi:divalent metal cation (Fe/Co/Zn/Cd) transporter